MFAPKRSSCEPISFLIEPLRLSRATAVPMPILMPTTRKAALPLRRFRFANAIVLTLMASKILLARLEVAGLDDEGVAFDRARQTDRVTAAVDFVDLRRMKVEAAVVADHVV